MKTVALVLGLVASDPLTPPPTYETIKFLLDAACADTPVRDLETFFAVADSVREEPLQVRGRLTGWRRWIEGTGAGQFRLDRIAPNGVFRSARVQQDMDSKPVLFVATGPDCAMNAARRLVYDGSGKATEIVHLDPRLDPIRREPLEPLLPPGPANDGIRVGMVDSGINYTLDVFASRLARDAEGAVIGFDYWDMDALPFDSNPARSPFFPQRHGTRTASLVVKEARLAALVPYRYPRPDMHRMKALVDHAATHGVGIVGMPLGSNRDSDWQAFAEAARLHPDMLFVISAGNNGRDIDRTPVFPASLPLENAVVVSSADDYGGPARGSNWGPRSVDLLVPAERIEVTDFAGRTIQASGSSYAVSRVVALAARLQRKHPHWSAPDLISAIYAMADTSTRDDPRVRVGFLTDPLADTAGVDHRETRRLELARVESDTPPTHKVALQVVLLNGAGWSLGEVQDMLTGAAQIYAQCGVLLDAPTLHVLDASDYLLDFSTGTSRTLVQRYDVPRPTVYLVRDSKMEIPFDGEAFGLANSTTRPWLTNTVWLAQDTSDPDIALAHELFHVLTNDGSHSQESGNLMQPRTSANNRTLSTEQCAQMASIGVRHYLVRIIN